MHLPLRLGSYGSSPTLASRGWHGFRQLPDEIISPFRQLRIRGPALTWARAAATPARTDTYPDLYERERARVLAFGV